MKALHNIVTLLLLDLTQNNISEEAADDIAMVLSHNTKLQAVRLGGNNLQSVGAIKIAKGLSNVENISVFDLSKSIISKEAADYIANILSHNTDRIGVVTFKK